MSRKGKTPPNGWTWFDNEVIERLAEIPRRSRANALAVYVVLAKHADGKRECYPSQKHIAGTLGISKDTVQRAIKTLEAAKLVSSKRVSRGRGGGCFNVYSLALQNGTGAVLKQVTKPQKTELQNRKKPSYKTAPVRQEQDPKNKTHIEQDPPQGADEIPTVLHGEGFATAWEAWERHWRENNWNLTPTARKRQLATLSAWGVDRAVDSIWLTIEHGNFRRLVDPEEERAKANGKHKQFTLKVGPGQRHPDDKDPFK